MALIDASVGLTWNLWTTSVNCSSTGSWSTPSSRDVVAVMAAVIGWFMVIRRQSFAGHTIAWSAFPVRRAPR